MLGHGHTASEECCGFAPEGLVEGNVVLEVLGLRRVDAQEPHVDTPRGIIDPNRVAIIDMDVLDGNGLAGRGGRALLGRDGGWHNGLRNQEGS